jgi:hypothetical protein
MVGPVMYYRPEALRTSARSPEATSLITAVLRLRRKDLVSAVMTTRAKSRISHGLFVVRSWLTDPSADVAPVLLFSYITCIRT